MIGDRSVIGIIPARGGSKGIPRKNIALLGGKPLIAWTILAAKASKHIDRLILTSDDHSIIEVARQWGCEAPFVRPAELASDEASGTGPLIHALQALPGYHYAVLLQPTSPLRTAEDIDMCIALCAERQATSVVSVTRTSKHPAWMYRIEDGRLHPLLTTASVAARRQDLSAAYVLNGAVYVLDVKHFIEHPSVIADDTLAYAMPEERSIDIDIEIDLALAELLLERSG